LKQLQVDKKFTNMLNRLIKFRIPSGEKVDSETTLWIKADTISSAGQFEIKKDGKSFAWIFGGEKMDLDPLIPKAIWELNGSERL
jgi:L-fucose isomerase-like protein